MNWVVKVGDKYLKRILKYKCDKKDYVVLKDTPQRLYQQEHKAVKAAQKVYDFCKENKQEIPVITIEEIKKGH